MKLAKFIMVFGVLSACAMSLTAPALAQTAKPQYNPQCWKQKDCVAAKKNAGATESEAGSGWLQEGDCIGDWGKCLAGKVTVAEVSFGGNASFRDVGAYIKTVYNYSLVVIGILAVVIIVIAGAQWTSSAGNAEIIGRAKKRITGAVIGLFIAFMSYNILNTINPATINLRLPQVWLLRSIALAEPSCIEQKDVNPDTVLSINEPFFDAYKKVKPSTTLTKDHKTKLSQTQCGVVYDLPNGDKCKGSTCNGWTDAEDSSKTCGAAYPCACYYDSNSGQNYCKGANLGGVINMNGKFSINDWYVDYMELWAVCEIPNSDYYIYQVQSEDTDKDNKEYSFSGFDPDNECGLSSGHNLSSAAKLVGYFATLEVNDAELGPTMDDNWIVGKKSCGSSGKPIAGFTTVKTNPFWEYPVNGRGVENYEVKKALLEAMISAGHLWTAEDLKKGVTCDFITNVPPYNIGLSDSDLLAGIFYIP